MLGFYGISTLVGHLMLNPIYTYISNIWFGLIGVGFYGISTSCRSFNAKFYLYIYIKYIWFGLVGFYGISTLVGHLMLNPIYTYFVIHMIGFGWVLWHINPCRSFNAKFYLYIYIYIYTYIIYIYIKYIWFGFMVYQP